MKNAIKLFGFLLFVPLLSSCMLPGRELVTNAGQISPNQVVIIGKVILTPPLEKDEQKYQAVGTEGFRNKMLLITGDQMREVSTPLSIGDLGGRIEAPFEKTFFAKSDAKPFYVLLGDIVTRTGSSSEMGGMAFPAGFKVDIQPGDRAIYIGTIHYYRDEFSRVTKVEVVDQYDEALSLYQKNFGGTGELKKELVTISLQQ